MIRSKSGRQDIYASALPHFIALLLLLYYIFNFKAIYCGQIFLLITNSNNIPVIYIQHFCVFALGSGIIFDAYTFVLGEVLYARLLSALLTVIDYVLAWE